MESCFFHFGAAVVTTRARITPVHHYHIQLVCYAFFFATHAHYSSSLVSILSCSSSPFLPRAHASSPITTLSRSSTHFVHKFIIHHLKSLYYAFLISPVHYYSSLFNILSRSSTHFLPRTLITPIHHSPSKVSLQHISYHASELLQFTVLHQKSLFCAFLTMHHALSHHSS